MHAVRSAAALVTATLAIAGLVAACGAPPRDPSVPPTTPAPSSAVDVTRAALLVQAQVVEGCGAIGGCAYFVGIESPGAAWEARFIPGRGGGAILAGDGLPGSLPAGEHEVTLWVRPVSDDVGDGVVTLGPTIATCTSTFLVAAGLPAITILGAFDARSCEIEVRPAGAQL